MVSPHSLVSTCELASHMLICNNRSYDETYVILGLYEGNIFSNSRFICSLKWCQVSVKQGKVLNYGHMDLWIMFCVQNLGREEAYRPVEITRDSKYHICWCHPKAWKTLKHLNCGNGRSSAGNNRLISRIKSAFKLSRNHVDWDHILQGTPLVEIIQFPLRFESAVTLNIQSNSFVESWHLNVVWTTQFETIFYTLWYWMDKSICRNHSDGCLCMVVWVTAGLFVRLLMLFL